MDDIYDNLDNFNEEPTIAELQTENKELKSKLQEYASTLDTLQKDFDKLTLEYKKLELNYSSLLKTAKAEIERKTQIISNLNIEKDKMVLMSLQNKNAGQFSSSRAFDNQMFAQKYKIDRGINKAEKEKEQSKKSSPQIANERKDESPTPISTTSSPKEDIKSKLLNMANSSSKQIDPKIKNGGLKENTIQPKENSSFKSRELIKNRRKSMSAVSLEIQTLSTDDNNSVSNGRSQQHAREHKDEDMDCNYSNRQSSRISEPSSLEDKNSGCHEPDAHKSRYANDKRDRYRARDKSSLRYKNLSPDRYHIRSKEFHENSNQRFEYDKYRGKGRVLESPPKDRYHWRPSREQHRNIYERNHPHDYEKFPYHSQEKYPMKHKIPHSYDESENKRMKVELHYKQHENRRLQEEREFLEKKYHTEPLDLQFSSCESPDYSHSDVSTHHIKEIKLTATTKLDDPRISNKKYVLKKNNGEVALSTIEGRNVDIVPINKIAWGLKHVSMPEALVRKPSPVVNPTIKNDMEIENPIANISMESGELCNSEDFDSHSVHKEISIESKIPKSLEKEIAITSIDETEDIENSLKIVNSYKTSKLRKTVDNKQSSRKAKQINKVDELILERHHSSKIECSDGKNDENKAAIKTNKEQTLPPQRNKQENVFIPCNYDLPNLGDDLLHEPYKGVIEDDLLLSDDNCDNNEQSSNMVKENICKRFEMRKGEAQICENTTITSAEKFKNVTIGACDNKMLDDAIKNKNKNSADKLEEVTIEIKTMNENENKTLDDVKKNKNKNSADKLENVTIEVNENKTLEDAKKSKNKNSADKLEKVTIEVNVNKTLNDAKKNKNKNSADKLEKGTIEVCENKTLDDAKKNKNKNSAEKLEKVTKEACENKTLDDAKKNKNKRKIKHKETKEESKSIHPANEVFDNPIRKKGKETKTVQIKTKFSELFDDSTSLICPEDLGIYSAPAPTERLPDKCVPFFEDALDATEMNTVKETKDFLPEKSQKESAQGIDVIIKTNTDIANTVQEPIDKISDLPPAKADVVNESFYKNLQPGVPEKDVIKTVIISSGVQPQVIAECEKQQLATETATQRMTENQTLIALATSTPHKSWQSDKADTEAKLSDNGCNSNDIQINSFENAKALEHSDNTLDSLTNSADVPDVRIFVRRRRKVNKK